MKKYSLTLIIFLLISVNFVIADGLKSLWRDFDKKLSEDLPSTRIEMLDKIIAKAGEEKSYGDLMKAIKERMELRCLISTDSFDADVKALENTAAMTDSSSVAYAIYNSLLGSIYREKASSCYRDANGRARLTAISNDFFIKSLNSPEVTADVYTNELYPFFSKKKGTSLLVSLSYNAGMFDVAAEYFSKTDRRDYALIMSLEAVRCSNRYSKDYLMSLDSLMSRYGDLNECCEVAIAKFNYLNEMTDTSNEDKIKFIRQSLKRWGRWNRADVLKNEEIRLTQPSFEVVLDKSQIAENEKLGISLKKVRNINKITTKIWKTDLTSADIAAQEENGVFDREFLKEHIKDLRHGRAVTIKKYFDAPDYEFSEVKFDTPSLGRGIYIIETSCNVKGTEPLYNVLYVSNLYVMSESLPQNQTRIAVTDVSSGQPVKNAALTLYCRSSYRSHYIKNETCNSYGEIIFENNDAPYIALAHTDADRFMPVTRISSSFRFRDNTSERSRTSIFTDRAVYRPGQTVKVAVVAYKDLYGRDMKADSAATISLSLRDAGHRVIAKKELSTDAYGTASAEFVLPSKTLNGRFTISDDKNGYTAIRVEEYKRPSFEVKMSEPDIKYQFGDTVRISARAVSFTGVPVQGARVGYRVKRMWYPWLRYYAGSSNDIVASGNTVTSAEGSFAIDVPLTLPDGNGNGFYHFIVEADVTDAAGETETGRLSLPVSSRDVWLECDLPDKIEKSRLESIRFNVSNTADSDIDTEVTFSIDGKGSHKVRSNSNADVKKLVSGLSSGRHVLAASAMGEKIEQEFILFSLDDHVPAADTDEWFYLTSGTFPEDGGSVSLQIGSSRNDVHVLYTVISGSRIISIGTVDLSNEVKTYDIKYRKEYGDGILISYAWVKNGVLHSHYAEIKKALPEKHLDIKWSTFRDNLVPGQEETWTMHISHSDSTDADASLIATLYDMSLDRIVSHKWSRIYGLFRYIPHTRWTGTNSAARQFDDVRARIKMHDVGSMPYEAFPNIDLFGNMTALDGYSFATAPRAGITRNNVVYKSMELETAPTESMGEADRSAVAEDENTTVTIPQLRENLSETAFFYPSLITDENGNISISFTLPESITTWKFMAFAHDKQMSNEIFTDEAVASKKLMIQPNMPRFIRRGDKASVSARIFNLSDSRIEGRAVMQICSADDEKVIKEMYSDFDADKGLTSNVSFNFDADMDEDVMICRIFAKGKDFSDGEQHYLNILSDKEAVTKTQVVTLTKAGIFSPDTKMLFGKDAEGGRITLEYTDNPQWLVIQALPSIADISRDDAVSTATKIYAGALAHYIAEASPETRKVIEAWGSNNGGSSLISRLNKNVGLKNMMLEETPWAADSESETERMKRLAELFDESLMNDRISETASKLRSLQLSDGSWSWWQGMGGNRYITLTVTEMLVRLETMTDFSLLKSSTDRAMNYLASEIAGELKNKEKADRHKLSSFDLRYLYLKSLRKGKADVNDNILLKKLSAYPLSEMNIYDKAMAAVILNHYGNREKALGIIRSIKEYSVYSNEMGRYFDTRTAGYSWCNYKIPTQVMVIEALKTVTPGDTSTIAEMQQWLLQEKRTTSWDTPINSVNAVYAFTKGGSFAAPSKGDAEIKIDGKVIRSSEAGTGYIRTSAEGSRHDVSINKKNEGMSWLSLYGTYTSDVKDIEDSATGIKIKKEVTAADNKDMTTGSRIRVRITITADRDYDFVQVTDKRAACMEPVNQISGYNGRYYCSMKDNAAYYYFDMMPKGSHVIETEYYADRKGSYSTGTCSVQCAYAPEYRGTAAARTINVK